MKVDLHNWSEAELDLISAKAIVSMLSESLFEAGYLKEESEVAYAVARLIESALGWIADGSIAKEDSDEHSNEDA